MKISAALESDMPEIERLARSFDLDCEDFSHKQFIVVKKNEAITGFGRLRTYTGCTELATVGVIPALRKTGVAALIINELIRTGPNEIFLTCVIPDFFKKFGFKPVKDYPLVLEKKVDFCKSYNFKDENIFVMKLVK